MLELDFLSHVADFASPRMGTECISPLLYSLVRMVRPATVLEVGVGYTTPFILKALADNVAAVERERVNWPAKNGILGMGHPDGGPEAILSRVGAAGKPDKLRWLAAPPSLATPEFYDRPYEPRLIAIDDLSSPHARAAHIQDRVTTLEGRQYLTILDETFRGLAARLRDIGPFDFMWFDCGGHREYTDFLDEYWPLLNGNGGLLLMHYTLTNLSMGSVLKDLKLRQATTGFGELEVLSLREPHKMMQNSVSLIRKTSEFKDRIYYEVRDVSLESDWDQEQNVGKA